MAKLKSKCVSEVRRHFSKRVSQSDWARWISGISEQDRENQNSQNFSRASDTT